jgi:hypothetical protein
VPVLRESAEDQPQFRCASAGIDLDVLGREKRTRSIEVKIVLAPAFVELLLIAFKAKASAQAPAPDQPPVGQGEASGHGTTNPVGTVVDLMTGSLTVGSQPIPIAGPPGPPPPP